MTNNSKNKKLLFHYTSVGTLLKIIDNGLNDRICLRATNARFFNDPYEYKFALSLLKSSMVKYEKEKSIKNKLSQKIENKLFDNLSLIAGNPFLLSLSEKSDELDMWRTYGVDGKGVSIGLDKDMLLEYSKDERNTNTRLYNCIYDKNKIIKGLIKYWEHLYDKIKVNETSTSIGSFNFVFNIIDFSFQFKREEYKSEKEWRLCKNELNSKNYKFIERDGVIIPFIEYYFPKEIIKKIIIGPCSNKQLTKESIVTLLNSREYKLPDNSVIISKVPYRRI